MNIKQLIFGGGIKAETRSTSSLSGSIQDWLPIITVTDGVVITKDRRAVKIVEVMPVNFHLKPPQEQQNIIHYFASYLKIAPNSLQIRVLTQRLDMDAYVEKMKAFRIAEDNEKCRAFIEDNITEVSFVAENDVTTHRFFIAFEYEPQMKARTSTIKGIAERMNTEADTARRYLELCELEVIEPEYTDNATMQILFEMINKSTSRRVRLPAGVFDMVTAVHGVWEG